MAGRKIKNGNFYWSIECDFFNQNEIRLLMLDGGCDAVCIYLYYCNRCLSNSFFVVFDEIECKTTQHLFGFSEEKVKTLLEYCFKWELFDRQLFKMANILTSVIIQQKFQDCFSNRGKTRSIEVFDFYWLLDSDNTYSFISLCSLDYFIEKNIDYFGKNTNYIRNNYNYFSNIINRNKNIINNKEIASPHSFIYDDEDEEELTPKLILRRPPTDENLASKIKNHIEENIDEGESETNEMGLTADEYLEIIAEVKKKYNYHTHQKEYYNELTRLSKIKREEKRGY
jgi:hypothetical protein